MAKRRKFSEANPTFPRIKVVGVGGAGGNAVSRMFGTIRGVEFVAINTDLQDLTNTDARIKVPIGRALTRGMGAGMNPEVGRQAAEENRDDILKALEGSEMVFITCGLGGGTGSGGSPIVADCAKDLGALTIAVITKPFLFEGAQRHRVAEDAWKILSGKVDAIITVPNDRVFNLISRTTPILEAFSLIDDILRQAVQGVSDLIARPGLINVDYADVRTIMHQAGPALLGIGIGGGEHRAREAASASIHSPLLELSIEGARGVLFNISGRENMSMAEVNEVAKIITESIDSEARIIFGATFDPRLKSDQMKVTVIATGFGGPDALHLFREVSAVSPLGGSRKLHIAPEVGQSAASGHSAEKHEPVVINGTALREILEKKLEEDKTFETPAFFRRKKKQ